MKTLYFFLWNIDWGVFHNKISKWWYLGIMMTVVCSRWMHCLVVSTGRSWIQVSWTSISTPDCVQTPAAVPRLTWWGHECLSAASSPQKRLLRPPPPWTVWIHRMNLDSLCMYFLYMTSFLLLYFRMFVHSSSTEWFEQWWIIGIYVSVNGSSADAGDDSTEWVTAIGGERLVWCIVVELCSEWV